MKPDIIWLDNQEGAMKKITSFFPVIIAAILALNVVSAPEVTAASFSFAGNFTRDDNVLLFTFSLLNNASVSVSTSSYASGGFDPTLTLFDSSGVFIDQNQDISTSNFDSSMTDLLLAGNYIVALTQYDNFPVADDINNKLLSDGFTQQGQGNFTGPEFLGGPGSFINIDGEQRTSLWAVDFQGVDAAGIPTPVPEPSTLLLFAAGLAGMYALRRGNRLQPRAV
jgi:hypothetical protein